MADEKKPESKAPEKDMFVEVATWGIGALLVLALLTGVFNFIDSVFSSNGPKAFTPEGIMLSHTRPIASLANPIGVRVAVLHNGTTVYNDPGGKKSGNQDLNARGKILQGPVMVGGVNYYYVDFDTGTDGWVKEGDIGYVQSEPNALERVIMWLFGLVGFLEILSALISVALIYFLFYVRNKIIKLNRTERAKLYPTPAPTDVPVVNPKWERISLYVDSQNENDWRLAIIEADIMLAELLENLGLPGDTIADKLKAVEKSDFLTLDAAWEGHKIRNQIAHDGESFRLSQRESRRVIDLYRSVFQEFKMI